KQKKHKKEHIETISEQCFDVDNVQLVVPSALKKQRPTLSTVDIQETFVFLRETIKAYRGKCIGKHEMHELISRITALSLAKGYSTTRFYIPDQDLSTRVFKINIIPGYIRRIYTPNNKMERFIRFAFPISEGELLNVRELEQGLEQIKRLPSMDVKMQLVPAEEYIGGTDVVLIIDNIKTWSVNASIDNAGVESTGKYVTRGGVIIDNPLGVADQISLGINSDTEQDNDVGREGYDIRYSIPWGYWNLSLGTNNSEFTQLFGMENNLISSGETESFNVKINHTFFRSIQDKWEWYVKTEKRSARSFLNDVEILVQRKDTAFAELGLRIKHYFGRSKLDVVIANRWGVNWFGSQVDEPNLANDSATFEYRLQTLDVSLNVPFEVLNTSFQYSMSLRSQWTSSNTYGSEFFSIGSRYSVRGFGEEDTLSGEEGFYWRNTFTAPLRNSGQSVYLGVDMGQVDGPSTEFLLGDTLIGGFVGVRGGYSKFGYDCFAGWPIKQPKGFDVSGPNVGASISFFY
ncbi:MAG: hypothetical protein COC04_01670, partial [Gammaproteobacteria bacterium]